MSECILYGKSGGGAGYNFKVVGGTSAPSNPKENTIWVNTSTPITSWDFSATEPQKRSGNKNLIVHPYDNPTTTINGVTFTPYTGGTIGASGTATAQATFYLNDKNPLILPAGTYTFSGAMEGGGSNTWIVGLKYSYDNFANALYSTTGTSQTITFDKPVQVVMYLQVKSGVTVSGNFKPQLEKGSTATSFVKGDATGQVWITTGTSSTAPFNALKKNNVQVYPLFAKQYVSGAWVDKTAKSYQNGAWVEIEGPYVIFESGKGAVVPCNTKRASNGSISVTANAITTNGAGSYTDVIFYTVDKIYVSEYKTLELTGVFNRINTNENYTGFGVMTSTPKASAYTAHTWAASMEIDKPNKNKETYIVDISNVNGAYYIAFVGADVDCIITDIKLRK